MFLKKLEYSEFNELSNAWSLKGLFLEKVNLLVGKNATGKTNTLNKIQWLGNMLIGLQPQLLQSGNYVAEFEDENRKYQYKLDILQSKVQQEALNIDDKPMFNRDSNGEGTIVTEQYPEPMRFRLSPNQLVVLSKRDAIQHPYLEKINTWADGLRFYEFGTSLGKDTFLMTNNTNNIVVNPKDANSVVGLFMKGEHDFPNVFRNRIKDYMKNIGYALTNIGTTASPDLLQQIMPSSPIPMPPNSLPFVIYAGEEDSRMAITQQLMSQGMFRALSIIIHLSYHVMVKTPATILIDDIGEGLDFDRSSRLIKLLIETVEKNNNIQLIMSTNDRFVMNNVPLEYWQVIQRKGGECQVFNYRNKKEKFDEFKYMGLNNFDFLATDYLNSEWGKA
jgi:AAA15 family ATPase/GTPase